MSKQPKPASTDGQSGRRTVVYARISKDITGEELGVTRQLEECRQYAASHGLAIVGEFSDNSISAYRTVQVKAADGTRRTEKRALPRPGYEAMLDYIEKADLPVEVVLAWSVDRIFRQSRMLEDFIDFLEGHTRLDIQAVHGSEYDLSTSEGRQTARIIVSIATGESERKSERIRSQKAQAASMGRRLGGGVRPFGYQGTDFNQIDEDEAALIRQWAQLVIAGEPVRQMALQASAAGIKTPRGNNWQTTTLRRLLTSARVGGKLEHNGVIVGPAEWPAILDEATQQQVIAILDARGDRYRRGDRKPTLLAGIAACGLCGGKLRSQPVKRNGVSQPALACRNDPASNAHGCGKIKVRGDWAEAFVEAYVLELLNDPDLVARLAALRSSSGNRDSELVTEIQRIEQAIARVNRFLVNGTLDEAEGRKAKDELLAEKRQVEAKLTTIRSQAPVAAMLSTQDRRAEWKSLGVEGRRELIAGFIKQLIVKPAKRGSTKPDPNRFAIILHDDLLGVG